ncbi:MAG: hypothetical protein ABIM99_01660 [Candidatus Dojkabacteria bacterium]
MGLLDFLSSKPAATPTPSQGGLVVNPPPAQGYTAQTNPPATQVQKSYKDLQYPMPGTDNNQLGTTVLPEANGLQPQLNYSTEPLPSLSNSTNDTPENHVVSVLDNGVRQVNHTDDVQTAAPLIAVDTAPQPLYSYTNNPVSAEVLAQATQDEVVPETAPIEALPEIEPIQAPAQQPSLETNIPGVTIQAPVPEVSIPALDESKNGDIIEIGSAAENPVSDESQKTITPAEVVTEPFAEVVPEPVVEAPSLPVEIPQTEVPLQAAEAPFVETIPADIMSEEAPVIPSPVIETVTTPIIEETPLEEVKPNVEINKQEIVKSSLTVLNKIAFISLNTQSVNSSLSKKVKSLAEMFKNMDAELYIDSNKGYGMDVISGLSGTSNKVTAAYLKPFFSKYSDETTLDVPLENLTKITFSTVLDRIKYLYKEATVFIVPETSGLNSLSQVILLLNSQSMYFGTHKPVILFGSAWKDRLNTLKNSFALSQQELDSMYFASTPEEVMSLLTKLDTEFSEKKVVKGSVVDMRDEQGEKEGLLS